MSKMFRDEEYLRIQGLTLLETMLALALGVLVVMGIVVYYETVSHDSNVTKAVADMNAIIGAYRDYATAYTITDDTTIQTLQDNDLLPNPLVNPWGDYYTATVTVSNTGGGPTIVVINLAGTQGDSKECQAIQQAVQPVAIKVGVCSFQYTL